MKNESKFLTCNRSGTVAANEVTLLICRRCGAITPDELNVIHDGQQIGQRCHCGGELVDVDRRKRQAEQSAAERQAV